MTGITLILQSFQSFSIKFLCQTAALSLKSAITLWRSWVFTGVYCITPLLTVLALGRISDALTGQVLPPSGGIPLTLQSCRVFDVHGRVASGGEGQRCSIVAYAPATQEVDEIMRRLAATHGFSHGRYHAGSFDVVSFDSAQSLSRAVLQHPGRIDAAIVFTNVSHFSSRELGSLQSYDYELWYNKTALRIYAKLGIDQVGHIFKISGRNLALQQAVDAAIIAQATGTSPHISADYKLSLDTFPQKNDISFLSLIGAPNVVPWLGPPLLVMGLTAQSLMVLALLVGEKGTLFTLRRMGLVEAVHWVSWFLVFSVPNVISALLVALFAAPFDKVNLFTLTDKSVLLVVWCTSSFGFTAMAVALATVTTSKHLELVCALVGLLCLGFTLYYSSVSTYEPERGITWQSERAPDFNAAGSALYFMLPFHHFGRMLNLILERTRTLGDDDATRYRWRDLARPGDLAFSGSSEVPGEVLWYRPEGARFSLEMLALASLAYLWFAWYGGQLFAGSDGTRSRPFWFPLLPSYWGIFPYTRDDKVIFEGDVAEQEKRLSKKERSVRVHKLSVSYGKVQALRESNFTFESGKIIALLGKNGAGKSSLINVLSGLVPPTFGHAFIMGMDVRTEANSLRRVMGACPQHDTLFNALTGREHLLIFCYFKNLTGAAAQAEISTRLEDVELTKSADLPAATYSGGMRRRLSVAVAAIANPLVVFYDEPTTGMDPIVKRSIWSSIQRLKEDRVIILTTHAMVTMLLNETFLNHARRTFLFCYFIYDMLLFRRKRTRWAIALLFFTMAACARMEHPKTFDGDLAKATTSQWRQQQGRRRKPNSGPTSLTSCLALFSRRKAVLLLQAALMCASQEKACRTFRISLRLLVKRASSMISWNGESVTRRLKRCL